jgi:hypothetical protein
MRQRILILTVAVLAAGLLLGAPGAFAWEIQHTGGSNPDGTPRFTDPDTVSDGMANHLSGGSGSGSGSGVKIGNSTFSFSGGSQSSSGMSPALQDRFLTNSSHGTVPNSNW